MLYFLVFCCYWWQSWNNSHALSPRFLLLLWTRLEQQSCFTSSFSVVTGDKVGTKSCHALEQQSCFTSSFSLVTGDKVETTVMLYFLVFCCYWWQSWNNSHALCPRFLLLLVTKLKQQSCFTSSFSVVTGDKVGTIVMLYLPVFSCYCGQGWNNSHALLPRFLLLLVTKLEQWSCFISPFSLVTVDKVGTTVMLYFLVFCCYWWQSWNNSHALSPRFLLLLWTKLEQQSCFISPFSLVTGDKVGTTVMLYLPVLLVTSLEQQSCCYFLVFCCYKVGTIVMLYLPVFSCYCDKVGTTVMLYFLVFCCYWWQSWNNSHALSPRFLLLLVTKLEQQSCFTSSFSLVTGDKVETAVMLYLLVFSCYCGQSWNNML